MSDSLDNDTENKENVDCLTTVEAAKRLGVT